MSSAFLFMNPEGPPSRAGAVLGKKEGQQSGPFSLG